MATGFLDPFAALDLDKAVGTEESDELAGEVDGRGVPGSFRPEHLERPSARRAGGDVRAFRRGAVQTDPLEHDAASGLDVDALVDVVEDKVRLFTGVGEVTLVRRVPVNIRRRRQNVAEPDFWLDALHAEARFRGGERIALETRRRRGGDATDAECRRDSGDVVAREPRILLDCARPPNRRSPRNRERIGWRRIAKRRDCRGSRHQ